jgi:hypothetical protein
LGKEGKGRGRGGKEILQKDEEGNICIEEREKEECLHKDIKEVEEEERGCMRVFARTEIGLRVHFGGGGVVGVHCPV